MRLQQSKYTQRVGWTNLPDSAGWDGPQTLILAFCSPLFFDHPQVLTDLKMRFPRSTIVGCSTSGEIQGDTLGDQSIVVNFSQFETSRLQMVSLPLTRAEDSAGVGYALAEKLEKKPDLQGALLFCDGLKTNGSKIVEGFNRGMAQAMGEKEIPTGGGLAGDGSDFQRTFVVVDGEVKSNFAVAIAISGESVDFGVASRGGWDIFGPDRLVTKSSGNILFELDGQSALDIYKNYLGAKASELPASGLLFPLQISSPVNSEKKLVRTILGVSEENKSLIFAGDVPEGWHAQLMRCNFERLIEGAGQASASAVQQGQADEAPGLAIAISCVGRRLVMGERSVEELEAVGTSLNAKSNVIGFYSYGELGPVAQGGPCELHNQSMTVLWIHERIRRAA